ncbi:MAG: carboxypeptidase-like regulatory domain-containing protein, partial [Bacteroidota bacterium]
MIKLPAAILLTKPFSRGVIPWHGKYGRGILLMMLIKLFIIHSTFAQKPSEIPATLLGTIINEQKEGIPGITVILQGTQKGVVTDFEGKYVISDIQPGTYTIKISGVSYEKQEFQLTFRSGQKLTRSITLKESTSELDEVVVTGESEARKLMLSAKSVQVIETTRLKLKAADMGTIMTQTEGVNVQRSGGLGSGIRFSLNGLSGDQVRFFHNDIPLEFTPYGSGIADVPVNMVDRAEIYKGVVPIKFGADALGGAVNLAAPEVYDGIGGSVSYQYGSFNTHRTSGYLNYANDQTGLFVVGGGFYDYTDNNYKIDVAIPNEQGQLQQETVERFHDAYRAYGGNIKVGIRNRTWANELSLEGYYGDNENEIQNSLQPGLIDQPSLGIDNAVAGVPFGDLRFTSFSKGLNMRYKVDVAQNWSYDLTAGYNYNERVSIDTSQNLYNWRGEVARVQNIPGEFGVADNLVTKSKSVYGRQLISYNISAAHSLQFVVAPTYTYRTADDLLIEGEFDPALDDGYLLNLVSGLEYTSHWLNKRLENILFTKYYYQSLKLESLDSSVERIESDKRDENNYGAGNALKYSWSPRFFTKLSYEYTYRLPNQFEVFGDGLLIQENLQLRPESSHNINFMWNLANKVKSTSEWQLQVNFFLRSIQDLIRPFPITTGESGNAELLQNQNIWSATSKGFELSGRWDDLIEGFTLTANTTYQRFLNTSDIGPFVSFEGDRIPNEPYFFANGSAEYELQDIFKKQDRLSFFWNYRYVHSFFIGWESAGIKQFKLEVPNQTTHTAGI